MQSSVTPGIQFGLMLCDMTVAPVVVKPDIDSNHALTAPLAMSINATSGVKGPLKTPPNQNGREPIETAIGHTSATPAKASLSRSRSLVFVLVPKLSITIPTKEEMNAGKANALSASSTESNQPVMRPQAASGNANAMRVHPRIR